MSKALLLLFARLLMSSLFVWDGVVQLRIRAARRDISPVFTYPRPIFGVDLDTGPSVWRPSAAREFLQPMGRCSACPCLPGHRFWRPSTGRRSEQHDPFLQEPGDDRRFLYVIAFGPGGLSLNARAA